MLSRNDFFKQIYKKKYRGVFVLFILSLLLAVFLLVACSVSGGYSNNYATQNAVGTIAFAFAAIIFGVIYYSGIDGAYKKYCRNFYR